MEFLLVTTELESSLIELKSSLIQFLLVRIALKSSLRLALVLLVELNWRAL